MSNFSENPFSLKKYTVAMLCLVCAAFLITTGCRESDKSLPVDEAEKQTVSVRSSPEVWDYPVKPGMEQWRQFKSTDEMFTACQVPENILKVLDTESLVQTVYDFPAFTWFGFFNSPQAGFNSFHSHFNGVRELLERNDVGQCLLKKYQSLSVEDFDPEWSPAEQGSFSFKYQYFEILLAQPQAVKSLEAEGRKMLLMEAVKKFDMKLSMNEVFGGIAVATNAWLMARILHYDNQLTSDFYKPEEIEESLQSGRLVNYDVMSIYEQAKSYANE